jgi:DNA helicase-2/ATP-dependent DNA helicase PcrA
VLEHALFSAGLPYRVYGGLRFFERQEIKHALAYLRLIANADDDASFARVVNFPTRGIGARSIETLQDAAQAAGSSLHAAIPALSGAAGAKLADFAALISKIREAAHLPLSELVDHVIELSGMRDHYKADKEGQDRLANLDELVTAAANFTVEEGVASAPGGNLADAMGGLSADLLAFLAHAALEAGEHQAGEGDDAVQLMTTHAAKGLEFNVVFLTGLEEGLFPHENSLLDARGLEEERRLMYVAVTRARQRLYLSHAQTRMLHGQTRYNLPARFIGEIPEGLMKWLTPGLVTRRNATRADVEPHALSAARVGVGNCWRIGQGVRHAKFGEGIIINLEGSGTDARVQINFGGTGMKWLALSVAPLEAA